MKSFVRRPVKKPPRPARRLGGLNKSALRTLEILAALADRRDAVGVTELSRQFGSTKTLVHRALGTLLEQEYAVRDRSGRRYEIGPRVLEFLDSGSPDPDISMMSLAAMRELNAISGESVMFGIPVEHGVTAVFGIDGRWPASGRIPRGVLIPAHASAGSRAILSMYSDEEIEAYIRQALPLKRFTSRTITDPVELRADIAEIRRLGYAFGRGDFVDSVRTLAFPLADADGRPHGTISVIFLAERFDQDNVTKRLPDYLDVIGRLQLELRCYFASSPVLTELPQT